MRKAIFSLACAGLAQAFVPTARPGSLRRGGGARPMRGVPLREKSLEEYQKNWSEEDHRKYQEFVEKMGDVSNLTTNELLDRTQELFPEFWIKGEQLDSAYDRRMRERQELEEELRGGLAQAKMNMSDVAAPPVLPPALNGGVAVSGLLDAPERTDQQVFDVLHAQGVWERIVALCPDPAFARKRLISRSARYSGLTDVLRIEEFDPASLSPEEAAARLREVDATSWLAWDPPRGSLEATYTAARLAGIERLVTLVPEGDVEELRAVAEELRAQVPLGSEGEAAMNWTVIATGPLETDAPEGTALRLTPIADLEVAPTFATMPRATAARVAGEALVLSSAQCKAVALAPSDEQAAAYGKFLREEGYDRREELAFLYAGGLEDWASFNPSSAKEKKEQDKKDAQATFKGAGGGKMTTSEVVAAADRKEAERVLERAREGGMELRQLVELAELRSLTRQELMEVREMMDARVKEDRKAALRANVAEVKELLKVEFGAMKWRKKYDPKQTYEEYEAANWDRGVRKLSMTKRVPLNLEPVDGDDGGVPQPEGAEPEAEPATKEPAFG